MMPNLTMSAAVTFDLPSLTCGSRAWPWCVLPVALSRARRYNQPASLVQWASKTSPVTPLPPRAVQFTGPDVFSTPSPADSTPISHYRP